MPNVVQGFAPPAYWQAFQDLTVKVARLAFDDPAPSIRASGPATSDNRATGS